MKKLAKGALAMVLVGSVTFSVTNALLSDQPLKRLVHNASTHFGTQTKTGTNEHASKRLAQINSLINFSSQKNTEGNQADKTGKNQTPPADLKNAQTTVSPNIVALQAGINNDNNNVKAVASIQMAANTLDAAGTSSNPGTANAISTTMTNSNTTTTGTTFAKSTTTAVPASSAAAPSKSTTTAVPASSAAAPSKSTSTTVPASSAAALSKSASTTVPANSAAKRSNSTTNHGQQVSQLAKEKAASHNE